MFSASETLPAFTEDVDVVVDADWVAGHEDELLTVFQTLGFSHLPGSPTFIGPAGMSLDLVGFSAVDRIDRIGGGARMPVMVFADLSTLLASPGAVVSVPGGGLALSPAALAAAKLLTIRIEKGSKDKLQGLLLIEEHATTPGFLADFAGLLRRFEPDRVEDAVADAQASSMSLTNDMERLSHQEAGYADFRRAIERGLAILLAQNPAERSE